MMWVTKEHHEFEFYNGPNERNAPNLQQKKLPTKEKVRIQPKPSSTYSSLFKEEKRGPEYLPSFY